MATNLGIRPQAFSVLFFVAELWVLLFWRRAVAAVLAFFLLQALWTNTHGAFAIGVILPVTLAIAIGIEQRLGLSVPRERQLLGRWIGCSIAAAIGCFVTPDPSNTWSYVVLVGSRSVERGLEEWLPTSLAVSAGAPFFVTVLLTLVLTSIAHRRLRMHEMFLLIVFFAIALTSQRMVLWSAIIAHVATCRMADHVWRRLRQQRVHPLRPLVVTTWDVWVHRIVTVSTIVLVGLCTPWSRTSNPCSRSRNAWPARTGNRSAC